MLDLFAIQVRVREIWESRAGEPERACKLFCGCAVVGGLGGGEGGCSSRCQQLTQRPVAFELVRRQQVVIVAIKRAEECFGV